MSSHKFTPRPSHSPPLLGYLEIPFSHYALDMLLSKCRHLLLLEHHSTQVFFPQAVVMCTCILGLSTGIVKVPVPLGSSWGVVPSSSNLSWTSASKRTALSVTGSLGSIGSTFGELHGKGDRDGTMSFAPRWQTAPISRSVQVGIQPRHRTAVRPSRSLSKKALAMSANVAPAP